MSNVVYVNVSGTWKTASKTYINVSGTWKEADDVGLKVSNTWKAAAVGSVGLPTKVQALGFDIIGFAVPIDSVVVDTRTDVKSLSFDILGFAVPIEGGMSLS